MLTGTMVALGLLLPLPVFGAVGEQHRIAPITAPS